MYASSKYSEVCLRNFDSSPTIQSELDITNVKLYVIWLNNFVLKLDSLVQFKNKWHSSSILFDKQKKYNFIERFPFIPSRFNFTWKYPTSKLCENRSLRFWYVVMCNFWPIKGWILNIVKVHNWFQMHDIETRCWHSKQLFKVAVFWL